MRAISEIDDLGSTTCILQRSTINQSHTSVNEEQWVRLCILLKANQKHLYTARYEDSVHQWVPLIVKSMASPIHGQIRSSFHVPWKTITRIRVSPFFTEVRLALLVRIISFLAIS